MSKKKNILCYIDELGSGGAERQISNLAILLKDAGYNVKVYCYHPIYFYEYLLKDHNVEIIKMNLKKNNYWNKIVNTNKVIKTYNIDTVIAYSMGPVIIASLIKILKPKIRLIASERNTTQLLSSREKIKFELLRFADYIVPNSHTQNVFIQERFSFLRKKTVTITNYIDTNKFHPAESPTINSKPKFIVVARHSAQKNVPKFIEAVKIAITKGVEFTVDWYGDNGGGNKDAHVEMAKHLGLSQIVRFYSSVPNIEDFYRKADFFCLPSLYEGFPNVICEAMSSGLPVICSDVCDNPYLIKDDINGFLFDPHNPESIADAIIKIISIPIDKRMKIGDENRKKAIGLFNKEVFLSKYIKLIEA